VGLRRQGDEEGEEIHELRGHKHLRPRARTS
jgi:hypothetical protein